MTDKELDELEARLLGQSAGAGSPRCETMIDAQQAIAELRKEKAELEGALEFYADPDTYVAISFFSDPPCGEFMDDFGPEDDEEYQRPMPGARARAALKGREQNDHRHNND